MTRYFTVLALALFAITTTAQNMPNLASALYVPPGYTLSGPQQKCSDIGAELVLGDLSIYDGTNFTHYFGISEEKIAELPKSETEGADVYTLPTIGTGPEESPGYSLLNMNLAEGTYRSLFVGTTNPHDPVTLGAHAYVTEVTYADGWPTACRLWLVTKI